MPKINKKAQDFLPEDLQVAINTFIEQFNIMEEYDLEHIPSDYVANLLETMSKYPCLLYTSPSPRDRVLSRMPSSA